MLINVVPSADYDLGYIINVPYPVRLLKSVRATHHT